MSDFTYEKHPTDQALETFEWDSTWLEHCEDTTTPRVLYIGDSISCGIRKAANRLADGKLLFDGVGTSKAVDNPFLLPTVQLWATQQGQRRFVLFNNGLHGWHLDLTEYSAHYEKTVRFLTKEFPAARLLLLLTTHVADPERDREVVLRNQAVLEIAAKYGLPTLDLYALSREHRELLSPDGVHLISEGYELLAKEILRLLSKKGE
ncbi:MAG: hypothetical protein IJX62_03815 [Clostridia bacterium]|nr:hypothetical protein [Clostridia bacterium]